MALNDQDLTRLIKIGIDKSVISDAKLRIGQLGVEINNLSKQQKAQKGTVMENTVAYKENAAQLKALQKEERQNLEILKQANTVVRSQVGSNNERAASLSIMRAAYDKLSTAEQANIDIGGKLQKNIKELSDEYKANKDQLGQNYLNVGNYENSLKGLKQELKDTKDAMIAASKAGGTNSVEFQAAAKKAGELKDQIDDVNAATKEMASGSKLGQFKDTLGGVGNSLKDLDFDEAAEKAGRLAAIAKSMTFSEMIGGLKSLGTAVLNLGKALIVNPFFAFVAAVTAVGVALKMWYDSNEEAIAAQKKLNAEFEKAQFETRKLDIEYRKINGTITAFQASVEQLGVEHSEVMKAIADDTEKNLKESIGWWEKFLIAATHGSLGLGKTLQIVKERNQAEKLETIKHTKELQNLYAQQIQNNLKRVEEATEAAAASRQEIADKRKQDIENEIKDAKEKTLKLAEVETQRLADLKTLYEQAEQERFDIRNAFLAERVTAQQTEVEKENAALQQRLAELRFAGLQENELEEFITAENTRIRVEAKLKQLAEAEALINSDAELSKQRAVIEIEDAEIRSATLFDIEKLRLEALQMLYDEQAATAMVAMDGAVLFDEETKARMFQKETEYQAQLVELNRQSQEKKRAEDKKTLDLQIQSGTQYLGFANQLFGNLGALAEEGSEEAKDLAIAQGIINALASAIAAYQSAAAIPVAGFVLGPIAAAAALAAGFANVAKIRSVKAARGVFLSDGQGTETSDSIPAQLSKNETVINAKSSKRFLPLLSRINEWGGGVAFANRGGSYDYLVNKFAGGGVAGGISNQAFQQAETASQISNTINTMVPVLVLEEFQSVQGRQIRTATNLEL